MTDALWGSIITGAVTITGTIVGLLIVIAKQKDNLKTEINGVKENLKTEVTGVKTDVKEVHHQINSRMDELLALTKASAYKAGVLQEQQRQKTKEENEKKSKK